jgi:5'(3')-deoxyribonucleotidase
VKSFILESSHQSEPIVYVDMDGTLADFFGEVAKREGATDWREAHRIKDRVEQVARKPGFFEELQPLPNAGKLIFNVLKLAGSYCILSAPLQREIEQSSEEKAEWMERHLHRHPPEEIIFAVQKEHYARQADGTPNILIDDFDTNIRLWEANGGIGILYSDENVDQAIKKLRHALEGLIPTAEISDEDIIDTSVEHKLYTYKQVLKYVRGIHDEYHLDDPIREYKVWQLLEVPVAALRTPEFYDQDDPYRRVIDLDWDHISNITSEDILRKPIVCDENGWVLDGNHRVTAARAKGLKGIRALIPYSN